MKNNKVYIGVDPGAMGGIAVLCGNIVQVLPMAKNEDIEEQVFHIGMDFGISIKHYGLEILVEEQHPRPGNAIRAVFSYGVHYGYLQAALQGLGTIEYITPQFWKKYYGLRQVVGQTKEEFKAESISIARKLYPEVSLFPTSKSRSMSDGLAEALLIAHYNREKESV